MIIIDADILSTFAKMGELDLLIQLFSPLKMKITPMIQNELSVPMDYGYSFPKTIFDKIETIFASPEDCTGFDQFQLRHKLGSGEVEAIMICKTKRLSFCTNDTQAQKIAREFGIEVISLQAILKAIWKKKLRKKSEVRDLIDQMKVVDNLHIKGEEVTKILED